MWYFAWVLGVGFAILLSILNGMWGELEEDRLNQVTKDEH
jgi:cyd operon protein YbgT